MRSCIIPVDERQGEGGIKATLEELVFRSMREGSGNSDSVLSGNLASPALPGVVNERSEAIKRTRRNHGAIFKVQVALTAIKGDKALARLAEQVSVHPTQITDWKQ